jgi:hypothetical protein
MEVVSDFLCPFFLSGHHLQNNGRALRGVQYISVMRNARTVGVLNPRGGKYAFEQKIHKNTRWRFGRLPTGCAKGLHFPVLMATEIQQALVRT